MSEIRALIIEDEIQMRRLLRMMLETSGYHVTEAVDGEQGLVLAAVHRPEVVLLDLGLPRLGGLETLRRLREWSDVPVLILSVQSDETVKVEALESGADDYVTKPFGTAELLARLAVIRRRNITRQEPRLTAGCLTLDLLHHEATLGREPLRLTPIEFALLKALATHPGRIVTQRQIQAQVWPGQVSDASEGLRVHLNHLRKKLATDPTAPRIVNEPGIGYRLVVGEGG